MMVIYECLFEFFEAANISYSVQSITIDDNTIPVYTSKDNKITIYCGDFFAFKHNNQQLGYFDFVWDNGTLASFPPSKRSDYVLIIASLLKENDKMLLVTIEFDQQQHPPFPYVTTLSDVETLYSSQFELKLIKSEDADTMTKTYTSTRPSVPLHFDCKKLEYFSWNFHQLTKK